MRNTAVEILDTHQVMAVSTLRPDGWPQTTFVGYVNEGLTLYFLVFRSSQKLANIRRDRRISIAIGGEPNELSELTAVYAAALAVELKDGTERDRAWALLQTRHGNLVDFDIPERTDAAMIRADLKHVSVLDYRKGPGHIEDLLVEEDGTARYAPRSEQWGTTALKPGMVRNP